jgi:CDP-diacylglycerol--glycerol-3-phosphate 3-phosphatidyltransferase
LVTPVLLVLLLSNTLPTLAGALVLFIIAAISDYLDGRLARTYQVRSRFGQFLDPFADKVLVLGTFITLSFMLPALVPWWAVLLIALRDVGITVLRSWAEANGRTLRTLKAAKWKTTFQLVYLIGMLLLLTLAKVPGIIGQTAVDALNSGLPIGLLIVVVLVTVGTGVLYATRMEYTATSEF